MERSLVSSVNDDGGDDVNDRDLREEIELVAVLAAAARLRARRLTLAEIDRLLGVASSS
ncbi:hypothetical protein PZ938_07830 [Luteipulveratus sp. YIM 133132]|uniref:Uncharacterized protein n=1 Tax=Luteipulveratus flavus TaxID=3031728 RepID=A0ABT6CAL9_9MICO|nr:MULTISPECIES: hypothetical protein [unclassified Luteipulveratus]MDE9365512.1 hypothetical protein [Luteipulveratus sp. YIM 133132]MDF8265573.1 hypothetical protein [Luteipulveratus sp. YIM 133296]